MKRPRSKGNPSTEAQDLAVSFLSDLDAERLADPSCSLASMLQGVRDGAEEKSAARIKVLEGHRNQWRRIALRLYRAIERLDAYADPSEFVRAEVDAAKAMLEEPRDPPEESPVAAFLTNDSECPGVDLCTGCVHHTGPRTINP